MSTRFTISFVAAAMLAPPLFAQYTERASVSTASGQATSSSERARVSADGRFVAFISSATNLVRDDTNAAADVFVRDLQTGLTQRVSVSSSGAEAAGACNDPAISADGRFVAFTSIAANLVANDTNGTWDVFVRDRIAGTTERVSVTTSGAEANGLSELPSISVDGRLVAFGSYATNLVPDDTNGYADIFLHDRQTKATSRVSISTVGTEGDGDSTVAAISGDGSHVAYRSAAASLVPGDTNGVIDIFVRDVAGGTTMRASIDSFGQQADGRSSSPSLSYDGKWLAFESRATNLVVGDTNGQQDVFLRDLPAGITTRIGLGESGAQPLGTSGRPSISYDGLWVGFWSDAGNLVSPLQDTNGTFDAFVWNCQVGDTSLASGAGGLFPYCGNAASDEPSISHDGRVLAFASLATNLVANDTNSDRDVFVRVREDGAILDQEVRRVSVTSQGFEADQNCGQPRISANGRVVSFVSSATNLVEPAGPAGIDQVFAHDVHAGTTTRVSESSAGLAADDNCAFPSLTPDGRYVAFASAATNLVPGDTNSAWDVFVRDRATGVTQRVSLDWNGQQSSGVTEHYCSISADGTRITFVSAESDLVPGDTGWYSDVFVHDRMTGVTRRVSVDSFGVQADDDSGYSVISADGRWVAFSSRATNLVPNDTNGATDMFVHDLLTGQTTLVSVDSIGRQGYADAIASAISADGRLVAFVTAAPFAPNDYDEVVDLYVHDRTTGTTTLASVSDDRPTESMWAYPAAGMSPNGRFVAFMTQSPFSLEDTGSSWDTYLRDLLLDRTYLVSRDWAGRPIEYDGTGRSVSDGGSVAFTGGVEYAPHAESHIFNVYLYRRGGVAFESFGHGVPGGGGLAPFLGGLHGDCRDYALRAWNGVGGAPGAVFFGFGESPGLPIFGGLIYIDFTKTWFSVPITLSGPTGVAGVGAFDFRLGTLVSLRGRTLVMQALFIDFDAVYDLTFTNGLRLSVGD